MDKKMTYTDALNTAIDLVDAIKDGVAYDPVTDLSAVVEKLTALKEQLVKRNSTKSNKPTKTQRENEGVKVDIVDILTNSDGMRCGEIAKALNISGQKCSALLKQLKDAGKVVTREGEKRVTLFALAEGVCGDSFIDPYEM